MWGGRGGGVGPNIDRCKTREVGGGWGMRGRYIVWN